MPVSFFMGRLSGEELGPLFYPVVLLWRSGPWQWLGLASLVVLAALAWRAREWSRRTAVSVAVIFCFLAVYLALITFSMLKFDRYLMPMLPALDILAALGLVTVWRLLVGWRLALGRFGWLACSIVLVTQAGLALPYHPYYYTYYNPLLGGARQAVNVVPVGTGNEGTDKVAAYLNSLPEPENIRLRDGSIERAQAAPQGPDHPDGQPTGCLVRGRLHLHLHLPVAARRARRPADRLPEAQTVGLLLSAGGPGLRVGLPRAGCAALRRRHELEGRATLHAFDLSASRVGAGQVLSVTVYFRNEGQREGDRFYVRLVDPDGYVWADGSVRPRAGFEVAFRTRLAIVEGEAILNLPIGMPPGEYVLKLGYVDKTTGQTIGEFALPEGNDRVVVELPATFPAPGTVRPPHPSSLLVPGEA